MSAFVRSEQTDRIVRYLAQFPMGESITYDKLSYAVGASPPLAARNAKLISARHILKRDHGQVWDCVKPGIGMVRLNDGEIVNKGHVFYINGSRRKLERGGDESDLVDHRNLNKHEAAAWGTQAIQMHIARETLSRKTRTRLERIARGTSNDLPQMDIAIIAQAMTSRTLKPSEKTARGSAEDGKGGDAATMAEAMARPEKVREKIARGSSNDLPSMDAVQWALILSGKRKPPSDETPT